MAQKNANKNPTPAKPAAAKPSPAKPASAPPVTKVEDLDDEDEDLDGDLDADDAPKSDGNGAGKPASWKDTMKLPPAKRVAVRLGNLVDRVQHQLDATKSWTGDVQDQVRAIILQAQDGLKAAAEQLAKVPDDWRPRRTAGGGGGSKVELEAGTLVRITEKRLPEYQDIISGEAARGIKVLEIRGNKVVCAVNDNGNTIKAMLPRGHVTVDVEAMEAEKASSATAS